MAIRKRNRLVTAREPNGRIQREPELAASEIRRVRDMAVRDARQAEWGTELGRLYLEAAITGAMYSAGKRWREQAAEYRMAIGVFPIRSASLERGSHGHAIDPDSEDGQKQAKREANGAELFFAAHSRLFLVGGLSESVVRRICEEDEVPCGFSEHQALRRGLSALVDHYNLTRAEK